MPPQHDKAFMDLVQLHERKWGDTQYPGRPALSDLFSAYVVALWLIGKRFILTAHEDHQSLNDLVNRVIVGEINDGRKLAKVFINQRPTEYRAVVAFTQEQPKPIIQKAETTKVLPRKPDTLPEPIRAGDVVSIPLSVIREGEPIRPGDIVIKAASIVDPSKQSIHHGDVVVKTGLDEKMKTGRKVKLQPGRGSGKAEDVSPAPRQPTSSSVIKRLTSKDKK